jgi:hypothetical protein
MEDFHETRVDGVDGETVGLFGVFDGKTPFRKQVSHLNKRFRFTHWGVNDVLLYITSTKCMTSLLVAEISTARADEVTYFLHEGWMQDTV